MAASLRGFGPCGTKVGTAPFHATEQRRTEPAAGGRWHERRTNGPALRGQQRRRTPGSLRRPVRPAIGEVRERRYAHLEPLALPVEGPGTSASRWTRAARRELRKREASVGLYRRRRPDAWQSGRQPRVVEMAAIVLRHKSATATGVGAASSRRQSERRMSCLAAPRRPRFDGRACRAFRVSRPIADEAPARPKADSLSWCSARPMRSRSAQPYQGRTALLAVLAERGDRGRRDVRSLLSAYPEHRVLLDRSTASACASIIAVAITTERTQRLWRLRRRRLGRAGLRARTARRRRKQ
jgi:hypothetical protein